MSEAKKQSQKHDGDFPLDTRNFLRDIQKEIKLGRGFVPFIGAGFSAPSGAPIIMEIQEYLQRCICICLGIDRTRTEVKVSRWNPRTDQWPPLVDRERKGTPEWEEIVFEQIQTRKMRAGSLKRSLLADPDSSSLSEELGNIETELQLLVTAHGAMGDWRRSLVWLAQIEIGEDRHSAKLSGGTPRQEVIDACFRAVLKDKDPTLGHKMLGALAGALRMDVVLTTNFDELIEKGFQFARNPLTTVEIPLRGHLPERTAISDVRALIKLHGGRSSVRANESLDESPSQEDKDRFLQYFLSPKGRAQFNVRRKKEEGEWPVDGSKAEGLEEPEIEFESHLLILGCGGKEKRVLDYIRHVCLHLPASEDDGFKVFWVCYSESDYREISDYFEKHGIAGSLRILRHSHASLLLLELYQYMRHELPPVGCIFPAISRTSQAPLLSQDIRSRLGLTEGTRDDPAALKARTEFVEKVGEIHKGLKTPASQVRGNCVVGLAKDEAAMMSAGSEVCRKVEMERGSLCLWIDMNDICSAENLYEVLVESMYAKLGIEDWLPCATRRAPKTEDVSTFDLKEFYESTMESYKSELERLVKSTQKRWYIFINCEEVPGANLRNNVVEIGNGWVEDEEPTVQEIINATKDAFACRTGFSKLFQLMTSIGISTFVNLRWVEEDAHNQLTNKLIGSIAPSQIIQFSDDFPKVSVVQEQIKNAIEWLKGSKSKKQFLHALCLMQRPRLLATIWSKAVSLDRFSKGEQFELPFRWLDELEDAGLSRSKPGGFIWIHSICREELRKYFNPLKENGAGWVDQVATEAHIHADLGDWYQHVVDATESPAAVCESAYHYCMAGQAYSTILLQSTGDARAKNFNRAIACFDAASATLRANSYLVQTHGYSRGSCRRLEQIGNLITLTDKLTSKIEDARETHAEHRNPLDKQCLELSGSVKAVWIACSEVMRAIAREVGEDFKAYERHRLNALVRMNRPWSQALRESVRYDGSIGLDFADELAIKDAQYAKKRQEYEAARKGGDADECNVKRRALLQHLVAYPDWIRWSRWSVMLHISSRSYAAARKVLEAILGNAANKTYQKLPLATQRHRLEILRLIEQFVELTLLEASLHQRSNGLVGDIDSDGINSLLAQADHLIRRGLKLAEKIRHMDPSTEAHDIAQANWCETRLLMHLSIVRARENPSESADSLAILAEAESRLRISDLRRARTELAMVDIHRAEVKLSEAAVLLPKDFGQVDLFIRRIIDKGYDSHVVSNIKEIEANIERDSRHCHALASDCLRFLGRAAPVLRERRRNVWWTTWYFERRMRVISLLLVTSMFETGTPIPILGLEAAMRATETECEQLIKDTERMVRVDSYRLASVINTLILCIQAFQVRLTLEWKDLPNREDDPRFLKYRQGTLLLLLKNSLEQLEKVERNGLEARRPPYELDGDVKEFVNRVKVKGNQLLKWGRNEDFRKLVEPSESNEPAITSAVIPLEDELMTDAREEDAQNPDEPPNERFLN